MSKVIDDLPDKGVLQGDEKRIEREPTSEEASLSVVEVVENTEPPTLPFSKGRCICLVLTVTGASFINVSYQVDVNGLFKRLTEYHADIVGPGGHHHPANHWAGAEHPRDKAAVDCVCI